MKAREYFSQVQSAILAAWHVAQSEVRFDEISESECYIRGTLTLVGGYELHLAEYTVTEPEVKQLKYRFHLQTSNKQFIARWDNASHHPEIATHPCHLHSEKGVHESHPMDMESVLFAVLEYIG